MKLSNRFRIAWWVGLTATLTVLLALRFPAFRAGTTAPLDVFVFLVWVALLLSPLFSEVSLFGISLKRELQQLRSDVTSQITSLKADISAAIDVRNTFSPQIILPRPLPDAQLPELRQHVDVAVERTLEEQHVDVPPRAGRPSIDVDSDVQYLFATRYNLEKELRRIASSREWTPSGSRTASVAQLVSIARETGFLSAGLVSAIREVNIICSRAIHGENVSAAQVDFVRDVASELIAALRTVR